MIKKILITTILCTFTCLSFASSFDMQKSPFDPAPGTASCSINTSKSACDVESGHMSDDEVFSITKKDSNYTKAIHKDVHDGKIFLYFFYSYDCPHCKKAHAFLEEQTKLNPNLEVKQYEVKKNPGNAKYFQEVSNAYGVKPKGVPTIFLGDQVFTGFSEDVTCKAITQEMKHMQGLGVCPSTQITVPKLGTFSVDSISLPSFTFTIGLLDGINPCAMWVLMFLLGLMTYAKDRRKVCMLGTVFVIASGVVYFSFMAAWLNFFWILGISQYITIFLGSVAIIMGLINVKELFFFKKGISLMIPESAKPTLYKKARNIINEQNKGLAIGGTILLAVFVNFIELGCTIGLPAIYTRILSLKGLSMSESYMYMAFYNMAYVIPLAIIVTAFAFTMGHFKITEGFAKGLKLVSGFLMLTLGLLLILYPEMLVFT